jgi:hypothetical protein
LRKHGILLIFDEVVTAYGRVGEWFAAQHFNVQPDIIITAKGITSGYIPLGAVLTTDAVAAELEKDFGFPMGFTYNGHPTAAAVALKNLEIIEEEGLLEKAKKMGQYLHEGLRTLLDLPIVGEVRFVGMMHAVELVTDKESRTPLPMLQPMLPDVIRREEGVIVRDCAHNLVLSPPLIMTEEEADLERVRLKYETDLDKAISYFDNDKEVKVAKEIGKFYFSKSNWEKAVKYLNMHLKNAEDDIETQLLLLQAYTENLQFADLAKKTDDLTELFPTQPQFYYYGGLANNQLKSFKKAATILETGLDFVVDDEALEINFNIQLGEAYSGLGDINKKDKYFSKADELIKKQKK